MPPPDAASDDPGRVRLGVSACLLGRAVRFDGGHKRDAFLTDQLGRFADWVPVCPEVELGMSTPRPAIRLEREADGVLRLADPRHGRDHTAAMRGFARDRVAGLEALDLHGYVLKKDSPSCGMERVRVRGADGSVRRDGRGLFAEELMRRLPWLPVEEEGRLRDRRLREHFVERIFACRRLARLFRPGWTPEALVRFQAEHKLQLMAHAPEGARRLGRLVAAAGRLDRTRLERRYRALFSRVLATPASIGRHVNVLEHIAGHLRQSAGPRSRRDVRESITDFARGHVPLSVPLALLRHHARLGDLAYIERQAYLEPHPKELALRSLVGAS